jgi:hypothetical protein
MTVSQLQISGQAVRLHLGRVPIGQAEPAATLARTVAANRKGHASIGARHPSPWLFPGGQPGRPVSIARLTRRLGELGIGPRQARSTALFQLATEIPAAILARTLGITPTSPSPGNASPQATGPPTPPTSAAGRPLHPGIRTVRIPDAAVTNAQSIADAGIALSAHLALEKGSVAPEWSPAPAYRGRQGERLWTQKFFAVRWPDNTGVPHALGRPALSYEIFEAPIIDPDSPAIHSAHPTSSSPIEPEQFDVDEE